MAYTITHRKVTGGSADPRYSVDLADWDEDHDIAGSIAASEITNTGDLTKTDDTNVTLTLGGTPTGALLKATSLTLGWTGTLSPARGGTGISSLGTGVATALGINVGSAGAFVTFNGALGTPSSGTLTNATGLPLSTGITGAGTGVLAALAINVGSAGAFITFNGALGTPSSGTLTSCTGLPISTGVSGLGSNVATFLGAPSSANLASALTDETGSGSAVFGTSPTITTPRIVGVTNASNATAGDVGEEMICGGAALVSATITMTIATPCVVTWTSNTLTNYAAITFTTTGALPTGVTSGTTYYVVNLSGNNFNIATSVDNAVAGTLVNTSGSQSGTHTGTNSANLVTSTAKDIGGLRLTAGDWDVTGAVFHDAAATTNFTFAGGSINTTANTLSSVPGRGFFVRYPAAGVVPAGGFGGEGIGPTRINVSSATTVYLNAFDIFTVSTVAGYGVIRARRIR